MKQVTLVKINTEQMMVDDFRSYIELQFHDPSPQLIENSDECVFSQYVDIDNCKIQKIVDHGVEHYIAVSTKIWEYLYIIDNPVTAKSQEIKIKHLEASERSYQGANELLKHRLRTIVKSSLWTRIRFLFTGIKIY